MRKGARAGFGKTAMSGQWVPGVAEGTQSFEKKKLKTCSMLSSGKATHTQSTLQT